MIGHQPPDKSRADRCLGLEVLQGVCFIVG